MEFKFYFLKEGTRVYEKSDLITFLKDSPNVTAPSSADNKGRYIFVYHHPNLNFEASFVMTETSPIPHIDTLDPKFYDVNFYVELDVLLSNYGFEIVLDMVEEICKNFRFLIYLHPQGNVLSFRRTALIKYFQAVKQAYAASDRYASEVAKFNKLDSQTLTQVYSYIQKRKRLELTFNETDVVIMNYMFYHTKKSRTAYVTIKWDGESQFVLPPAVDILYLDDGKINKFIPMGEIMKKAEKLFKPIDGYGAIQLLDSKSVKKLHKILTKEHFPAPSADLELISLDSILDI